MKRMKSAALCLTQEFLRDSQFLVAVDDQERVLLGGCFLAAGRFADQSFRRLWLNWRRPIDIADVGSRAVVANHASGAVIQLCSPIGRAQSVGVAARHVSRTTLIVGRQIAGCVGYSAYIKCVRGADPVSGWRATREEQIGAPIHLARLQRPLTSQDGLFKAH